MRDENLGVDSRSKHSGMTCIRGNNREFCSVGPCARRNYTYKGLHYQKIVVADLGWRV